MATQTNRATGMTAAVPRRASGGGPGNFLEREGSLGPLLMLPGALLLLVFMAYPFFLGLWLALTDSMVGVPGQFIGLANFENLLGDSIFLQTARNTFIYALVTVPFKLVLGLGLALVLNQAIPFRKA